MGKGGEKWVRGWGEGGCLVDKGSGMEGGCGGMCVGRRGLGGVWVWVVSVVN